MSYHRHPRGFNGVERWNSLTLIAVLATPGCHAALAGPQDPHFLTDKTAYQLEHLGEGMHRAEIVLTYTNRRARPVYLARHCGTSDLPERRLARADRPIARQAFVGSGCDLLGGSRPPIEVPPGATYQERVDLLTQHWHARPPRTMDEMTGAYYFVYTVLAAPVTEAGAVANQLLPPEERTSNVFQLLPPP
jgi:hypothetical protein